MDRPPCSVEGCEQPLYCRGLCTMHYTRLRRRGEIGTATRTRAPWGAGSVNEEGYRIQHDASHPLSNAQGRLLQHRAVLYDAIGPGVHACHWCGKQLAWRGKPSRRINADHLDYDRLNNDPSNLVPACLDCNTKRVLK